MDPTAFCNFMARVLSTRRDVVDGLRSLADFLEANPLWATKWKPGVLDVSSWEDPLSAPPNSDLIDPDMRAREHETRFLARAARAFGDRQPIGTVRKVATDYMYGVQRDLVSDVVAISATSTRNVVCTMVETGEFEEVAVVEIPDDVKARYTRVEQRPKMERVCVGLLDGGS